MRPINIPLSSSQWKVLVLPILYLWFTGIHLYRVSQKKGYTSLSSHERYRVTMALVSRVQGILTRWLYARHWLGPLDMSLILFVSSFVFSRFPTLPLIYHDVFFLLLFQSFCYHAEGTMKFVCWPFACDLRSLLPFLYYIIFQGLFRLISQSGSFALPAVIWCTGISLLPRSTLGQTKLNNLTYDLTYSPWGNLISVLHFFDNRLASFFAFLQ